MKKSANCRNFRVDEAVKKAMMKRLLIPIIAVALSVTAWPAAASCILDQRPVEQQIAEADTVFVGTVTSVSARDRNAVFRVDEVWKGNVASKVAVQGGPPGDAVTSVDRYFRQGTRYLVFPDGTSSPYSDNSCSPTREWTDDLVRYRPASATGPTGATDDEGEPSASGERKTGEAFQGIFRWAIPAGAAAALAVILAAVLVLRRRPRPERPRV